MPGIVHMQSIAIIEYYGTLMDEHTYFPDILPLHPIASMEGMAWGAKHGASPGLAAAWGYNKAIGCIYSKEQCLEVFPLFQGGPEFQDFGKKMSALHI